MPPDPSDKELIDNSWVRLLAPAIPSTLTAIAGFVVFHKLALKRQTRDEIYKTANSLIEKINDLVSSSEDAWRASGKVATETGLVSKVRFEITQIDLASNHLIARNNRFSGLHRSLHELKKNIDEYFDKRGRPSKNIADIEREGLSGCSEHAYASANLLKKEIYRIYAELY